METFLEYPKLFHTHYWKVNLLIFNNLFKHSFVKYVFLTGLAMAMRSFLLIEGSLYAFSIVKVMDPYVNQLTT